MASQGEAYDRDCIATTDDVDNSRRREFVTEWWAVSDATEWTGEHGQLLHLIFAAWLSLMECSTSWLSAITYRDIAIQSGRTPQQAYAAMRELGALGFVDQIEQGNDRGDLHGDPARDYESAVWALADPGDTDAGQTLIDRRTDMRIRSERLSARSVTRWALDEGIVDPDTNDVFCPEDIELLKYWGSIDTRTLPEDAFPWEFRPSVPSSGLLLPLAVSPLAYLTWSDAFQPDAAGLLGWALACEVVSFFSLDMFRLQPTVDANPPVSTRFVTDRLYIARSTANGLLGRLVERGFAKPDGPGVYRLLFIDAYLAGELATNTHRVLAEDQMASDIAARSDRRLEIDGRYRRIPGSRFRRVAVNPKTYG